MKIIRELQITSEEFYDFLESEFLNQMNESDNPAKYTGKLKYDFAIQNCQIQCLH